MLRRFKCCCCKELWDGITSFSLVKDGPVYALLKEIRREAPFFSFQRIRTALVPAATLTLPGHFTRLENLLSKTDIIQAQLVQKLTHHTVTSRLRT